VQTTCTIVSLPILVHWGLPISIMSIIGNLIFIPFLSLFLITSSLIFFTELCSIPNKILVDSLNIITKWWNYLLQFGKKEWLIGFTNPKILTISLIIILILSIIIKKHLPKFSLWINTFLILAMATLFIFYTPKQTETKFYVPHTNEKLLIETHNNKTITVIDNGYFNKKQSPEKWIAFELRPYLTQKFGTIKINVLTLQKPNMRTFVAAKELCESIPIKKVKLAYFNHELTKYGWKTFFEMKRAIEKNNIKFLRFENQTYKKDRSKKPFDKLRANGLINKKENYGKQLV